MDSGNVADNYIAVIKIPRADKVADTLTKHVSAEELRKHMEGTGLAITSERHGLAPGMSQEQE